MPSHHTSYYHSKAAHLRARIEVHRDEVARSDGKYRAVCERLLHRTVRQLEMLDADKEALA